MWNWKNDFVKVEGKVINIPYSRFVASWILVGGHLKTIDDLNHFKEWLRSLKIDEDDVHNISEMATNGKLELQSSAHKFIYGK